MKKYYYDRLSEKEIEHLCSRQNLDLDHVFKIVQEIEKDVVDRGDQCIRELTEKFDGVKLENFRIPEDAFKKAESQVSEALKEAIALSTENIQKFHVSQVLKEDFIETSQGVTCWRESRAIEKVGLYIPGGTAPLFSTILMSVIPAKIAGCEQIILCTPPDKNGQVSPEILWTAQFLGVEEVYKVGGAQAIFAMTYGTKQIPKVDKIFGPGNQFVTAAKILASQRIAIDMPAGPSEVLVIADKDSNPAFVASDLLSQAEHGIDSESVLVCTDESKVDEILGEVKKQLTVLPRKDMAKKSLESSYAVITNNLDEAIDFSNTYAPEHLILSLESWQDLILKIKNAGSVFCGPYSAESFGDYASGTNHILPTSGFARNFSGVSVDSFIKKVTFQEVTKKGLKNLGHAVEIMAEKEELFAHKNAVSIRLGVER